MKKNYLFLNIRNFIIKIFLYIFIILIFVLSFLNFLKVFKNIFPYFFSDKIIFFDIGQGDALLLYSKNFSLVTDGGPDNIFLEKIGNSLPYFVREIDCLVLSHYHDDHIIGLIEFVKRYRIKYLIFPYENENKEIVKILLNNSNKENSFHNLNGVESIISLKNILEFNVNDISVSFLNPVYLGADNQDNNSIISKINFKNNKILLSGDNELGVEDVLVNSDFDFSANIFKASHHGSKTSNSMEFLKKIHMDIVVISVGIDNKFNHPSIEVLRNFKNFDLKLYRTDRNGDVEILL